MSDKTTTNKNSSPIVSNRFYYILFFTCGFVICMFYSSMYVAKYSNEGNIQNESMFIHFVKTNRIDNSSIMTTAPENNIYMDIWKNNTIHGKGMHAPAKDILDYSVSNIIKAPSTSFMPNFNSACLLTKENIK